MTQAEQLYEAAGTTKDGSAVMAAARFWAERTDGKADGSKAEDLYRRGLPDGDLGTHTGMDLRPEL